MSSSSLSAVRSGEPVASRNPRAAEAARQFEGLFLGELWRAMQLTLPEGGPFHGGGAFGLYGELLGQELTSWLAESMPAFLDLGMGAGVEEAAEQAPAPPLAHAVRAYSAQAAPAGPAQETAAATRVEPPLPGAFLQVAARVLRHDDEIVSAAEETRLDPDLLRAVIHQESAGDPRARSPKGALGLMQILPDTARAVGLERPLDAGENIHAGARYLRELLDRFRGDLARALAAYNAGPGAVERAGGVPPLAETRSYVPRVLALRGGYARLAGEPVSASSASRTAPSGDREE